MDTGYLHEDLPTLWLIGMDGERELKVSMLSVCLNDNIMIYLFFDLSSYMGINIQVKAQILNIDIQTLQQRKFFLYDLVPN